MIHFKCFLFLTPEIFWHLQKTVMRKTGLSLPARKYRGIREKALREKVSVSHVQEVRCHLRGILRSVSG